MKQTLVAGLSFLRYALVVAIFAVIIAIVILGALTVAVVNLPSDLQSPSNAGQWVLAIVLVLFAILAAAPLIEWWYNVAQRWLLPNDDQSE